MNIHIYMTCSETLLGIPSISKGLLEALLGLKWQQHYKGVTGVDEVCCVPKSP